MINKVFETITKFKLIQDGDKIVLGVSGGPDSICMLDILNQLKKEIQHIIIFYIQFYFTQVLKPYSFIK